MTLNKYLRYLCLTGIFLIPFIPLIVANNLFFPFITGKNFAFRILVEIVLGAWVILAVTDTAYRPKKSWIVWILAGFVVVIAIADIFSVNPAKSFWSNYERMEGWVTLIHAFAYFIVAATVLNTEKLWNRFWNTSIGVSLVLVAYGFLQLAGVLQTHQGDRLDATLGNSAYFAVYLLVHIFIILYIISSSRLNLLSFKNERTWGTKTIVGLVILVLEAIVLFNTGTRGSILGLLAGLGMAAVLILIFERSNKNLRVVAGSLIAAIILVVIIFLGVKNTNFVKNNKVLGRFASISLTDTTTQSRFILWGMAWQGFKENPKTVLIGWGQESFNYVFNKYYDPRLYNDEQWFDRTHNVVFDWLIAGGALGLIGYLAFFIILIREIWKSGQDDFTVTEKSILTGLLVAYFVHNFFVFDNLISYILYMSFAAYIYGRKTLFTARPVSTYKENRIVAPVALVVLLFAIYYVNIPAIQANTTLIQAITPQGDISKNVAAFKQALAYNSFGTPEIREQIFNMTSQVAGLDPSQQTAATAQAEQQLVALTTTETQKQLAATPNDARYYILPGSVLSRVGQYDQAVPLLEKGVALTPDKQSALFELASAYIGVNQPDKALTVLKKAYDLAPAYDTARLMYGVGAIYAKDNTTADKILGTFSQSDIASSDQVLRAYYVTGQYQKLVTLWKTRVAGDPTDINNHVSLAAAYLLIQDKADAIAELQKAETIDPTFKDQGDQYIKGIQDGTIK